MAQRNKDLFKKEKTDTNMPDSLLGSKNKRPFYPVQNAVKFDVVKMLAGDLTFAYERKIGKMSTIEIEAGPTISLFGLNKMQFIRNISNLQDYDFGLQRESGFGGLFSIAYKVYLLNNYPAMHGLYIAPKFKFKNYNASTLLVNTYTNERVTDKKNTMNQFFLIFDVGMTHWFSPKFGIEYYATFGLATNLFKYNSYTYTYGDGVTTPMWDYQVKVNHKRFFNPAAGLGFKVNFGF